MAVTTVDLGNVKGAAGADGSTWLFGTAAPAASLGKNTDFYLNTATYDIYTKASGAWTQKGNIKGATGSAGQKGETGAPGAKGDPGANGAKGADGATWLSGTAAPTTQGKTGDFYINTATYDIYSKASGSWVKAGNIKGAAGATGAAGAPGKPGAKGTDGATWLSGSGAPTSQGKTGDFYLDTNTYDIYSKATGGWVKDGNIKGQTGAKGDIGATGATGAPGAKGADGATWLFGTAAPAASLGKNTDFYLNTTTFDVYHKASNAWTKTGNIKGASGASTDLTDSNKLLRTDDEIEIQLVL